VYVSLTNTYSYVPANGDIVTVTLTSNALCAMPATVSKSETITVSTPQTPSVKVTADPGDTVCQGKAVTLTATPTYGGTAPTYTWIRNTAATGATGPVFTYLPANGDIVYVNMASSFPCVTAKTVASNSEVMVVNTPLIPHVTIAGHANTGIGWTDTLTAVVTNGGTSPTYQWVLNGIPVASATTATYISKFRNGDSVAVEVTSSGLCAMSTQNWIYLNVSAEGVTPLTTTSGISVLPNPNKGAFTIKGSLGVTNDEEVSLELTDLLGQVVYKNKVLTRGGNINEQVTLGKSLANGMYLLSIRSAAENMVFHVAIEQ
jgi:hypothetical protein